MRNEEVIPRAPRHLGAETRAWFRSVVQGWTLEPHHVKVLRLAGEEWDRAERAREQYEREGLTIATRDGGCKRHPAVAIRESAVINFARLLRELDLDVDPPAETRRPPMLRSMRGPGHAA